MQVYPPSHPLPRHLVGWGEKFRVTKCHASLDYLFIYYNLFIIIPHYNKIQKVQSVSAHK